MVEHIMVIDDDEITNLIVGLTFEESNYKGKCEYFTSIESAIEKLSTTKKLPELIFVDMKFRQMNGWDFLDWLVTRPELAHIRVVMLSTSLLNIDVERANKNNRVEHFFSKPLTVEIINSLIKA